MGLSKIKIGSFVELHDERCNMPNLTVWDVSGINKDKEFFEPSKQVGVDTSNYKIVPPSYFACNLMHVGRDVVLPISLNHTEKNKIVSPAYTVFKIKDKNNLIDENTIIKEYFFTLLKSNEKDRYFWFNTDSSIRDGMSWEVFCDLDIDLPPPPIQQKYVDVYNAMLANQRAYERGLEDLNTAIALSLEKFKHNAPRIQVGKLLEEIDIRNRDASITNVQGININKEFMPSVANLSDTDLTKYKVIQKDQFAYSAMQTGRDECIRIALFHEDSPVIISPAYSVLRVINDIALSEYIMLWFSRSESDRYGWFISDSSIRASLELQRFYEIEIPLPTIPEQQTIVELYKSRYLIKQNINKIDNLLKDICPILIKGSFEEARKS